MEDEFHEHIQKRIRNLRKRQTKLEEYQRTREENPSKLNPDQLAALSHKDSVDAPLKELTEALSLYTKLGEERKSSEAESLAQEVKKAEQRGREEEKETLRVLTRFLRLAAVKHQAPQTTTPAELAAIDVLLQKVYMGDESSVEAMEKLAAKSDEVVEGEYTYAALSSLSSESTETAQTTEEPAPEAEAEAQISFLQEDELEVEDVVEAVPEVAEPAEPAPAAAPSPAPSKPKQSPREKPEPKEPREPNGKGRKPRKNSEGEWQTTESRRSQDKRKQRPNRPRDNRDNKGERKQN